jgi:hypothetical protein
MKVIVLNAIGAFLTIHEAKLFKGKTSFSAIGICDAETKIKYTIGEGDKAETKVVGYEVFQKICDKVAKEKFNGKVPAKLQNWAYNKADGSTTRDAYINPKTDEYYDGFTKDTWFISAKKGLDQVEGGILKILDENKKQIPPNSSKLYSGCRINMIVSVYAMDKEGSSIQASLEAIQYAGKGRSLGREYINAEDDFDAVDIPAEDMDEADAGEGAADVADDML